MNRQTAPILHGIDTIILRVSDINFSKNWYREKLSFKITYEEPALMLAVLDTGGPTSITLWQTSKPIQSRKETAAYPIFKTPDAEVARQQLKDNDVTTDEVVDDGFVKYFQFYDPDGNILEACQVH